MGSRAGRERRRGAAGRGLRESQPAAAEGRRRQRPRPAYSSCIAVGRASRQTRVGLRLSCCPARGALVASAAMTQQPPTGTAGAPSNVAANLQLKGGAAIVAPVTAFPGGVPGNALVVLPVTKPTDDLTQSLEKGPVVVTQEQMWALLGFRGPAVQVQDAEGRPLTIGLEDLLDGLRKHWSEDKNDLGRGRLFAQELMKYGRFEEAEKVMAKVVASGGAGEDWLGLGVAQLQQENWDKAEGTLKGARNLLPNNPFPSLHLAKVYRGKEDVEQERAAVETAITTDANCVDAWAYL